MIRKILGHSVLYFFATYVTMVANIFILPIIIPYMTLDDYAIYGLTFSYVSLLSAFADLGLINLFENSFFKERTTYKNTWGKFMGFLLVWRIFYALCCGVLLYFLFRNQVGDNIFYMLALVTIPLAFFDFTKGIGMRHCQLANKHKLVYISMLISGGLVVSTSFISIYFFRLGYLGLFLSAFVAKSFEYFYYGYHLRFRNNIRASFDFTWTYIRQKLKIVLPIIPKKYSNNIINSSDRAILDYSRAHNGVVSLGDIGLYNVAFSFGSYFGNFQGAVTTVVTPILFGLIADKKKENALLLRSIIMLWFAFSIYCALWVCLWIKEVVMFLYPNPDFTNAYTIAPLLVMGWCYRPMYVATVSRAIFHEKTVPVLRIFLIAAAVSIGSNLILIPWLGIKGAMISSFASSIVLGFAGFFIASVKKHIDSNYRPLLLAALLVAASIAGFFLPDTPLMWKIVIAITLVVVALAWYRFYGRNLIAAVNSITPARVQMEEEEV
ncbi:MAG: polysaccharide biosynthesis C-terminal domain-containing protein [Flavobacteriales bacterium]|nr:polysaccharide biosynthesis C-terminal domain-containing protein [Flavobacteriales bacterium]